MRILAPTIAGISLIGIACVQMPPSPASLAGCYELTWPDQAGNPTTLRLTDEPFTELGYHLLGYYAVQPAHLNGGSGFVAWKPVPHDSLIIQLDAMPVGSYGREAHFHLDASRASGHLFHRLPVTSPEGVYPGGVPVGPPVVSLKDVGAVAAIRVECNQKGAS